MTSDENILVVIIEECHEITMAAAKIGQTASKALRFGFDSIYVEGFKDNKEQLVSEFNDLVAMFELLAERGVELPELFNRTQIDNKKIKVKKFYRGL